MVRYAIDSNARTARLSVIILVVGVVLPAEGVARPTTLRDSGSRLTTP